MNVRIEYTLGHRELIEQCTRTECIDVILGRTRQSTQLNDNKSERVREWGEENGMKSSTEKKRNTTLKTS